MPGTIKSSRNCKRPLCVCWIMPSTFNQAVYNSILPFTSCLNKPSRLARGEYYRPSQVFPGHVYRSGLAYNLIYLHSLLNSQEYVRLLQRPIEIIPQLFLLLPLPQLLVILFWTNISPFLLSLVVASLLVLVLIVSWLP